MSNGFCIVANLWVVPGNASAFEAYEKKAAEIMARYEGKIERAIRVEQDETTTEQPFEIHLVSFPSKANFLAYKNDFDLKDLADERSSVIRKTTVVFGTSIASYHEL